MRPIQENDVFHAIAHPARRAMLSALRRHEQTAGDLAAPFAMSFAAVSQHLRLLEEAQLVAVRRDGRHRVYSLRPQPLKEVNRWVDEFAGYCEGRLDALGAYLDHKHGKRK
jgi:DNA-binding transcriptional ArsR family regulator